MTEEIARCLEIAGVNLTFQNFEIKGIPGFETSMLYKGEPTMYEVEKQWFAFQVSTIEAFDNDIKLDDQFTMEDDTYIYTFVVNRSPIPDLTGWSKLQVDFLSKAQL